MKERNHGRDEEERENFNVARFLPEMASKVPNQAALRVPCGREGNGEIRYREGTFAELEASANGCAAVLRNRGIARGDRVLLMVRPGRPLIEICFALFKLRAVPVVIDPGMGISGFLRCVQQTRPVALVGIPLAVALSRMFFSAFASIKVRVTVSGRLARCIAKTPADAPMVFAAADELAAILFTSGSTGPAKGVRYEHGMFDAQVRLLRDQYAIMPGEVDLPMLPIFALFNPALGMTTVVPEMNPSRPARVAPEKIVRAIQQNEVTNSFGSPVLWQRIAEYCERTGQSLPSLKRVLMAGAPAPVDLLRRLRKLMPGGEIHTPYGATECLPVASISSSEILTHTWERTLYGAGTCVGKAVPGVSIQIRPLEEPGNGRGVYPVPSGPVGEIVVTGPSVTKAYDRLPEATLRSKTRDEGGRIWHRMGDIGYLDEEGRLWFCGRLAERVVAGETTYLTDPVEAIFNQLEGVARSALIGWGEPSHECPVVVIEREKGACVSVEILRQHAKRFELTREIRDFRFCRSFPVDVRHNAKIHRLALKRRFEGRQG